MGDTTLCPGDLANPVGDGHDELFKGLEIRILRQANKDIGEVDARVARLA